MKNLKLGLRPRKFHARTLCLNDYVRDDLLPDPGPQDWTPLVTAAVGQDWGMDGNDAVGDCAAAMWSHGKMLFTANTGSIVVPTTSDTLALYSAVTGYDPAQTQPDGSNPTDQGTVMTDLLAYLQKTGEILAWAEFDGTKLLRYRQAVNLFGAAFVGVNIRQSDMDAFNDGNAWQPGTDEIEGGHAIVCPEVAANGLTYITWGKAQAAMAAWAAQETQEAYVVITPAWFKQAAQITPAGLNLRQLQSDLNLLK